MNVAGFDHLVLAVRDLAQGEAAYAALFGRAPSWRASSSGGGAEVAIFGLDNVALEIMAPSGEGQTGARLAETLDREGEGLKSLVLSAPNLDKLHRRWTNVGLDPEPIADGEGEDSLSRRRRAWRRTRARVTPGVRLFAVAAEQPHPSAPATVPEEGAVSGLDHLVIRTPAPERALAFYGAKLGLDLRMDRTVPDWGVRLLFFRCGDAVLEIAHDPREAGDGPDRLWGATWRVPNAEAARARLALAGLDVSDVRPGRKPGTRVVTVRNGTCGVPTLLLQPQS